jgi:hypothetical protein
MISPLLFVIALAALPADELKDGDPAKIRLAVMSLSADGVPPEYAVGLTETIATEIARTGVFETISPKQIASILAYEKRKDALGACVEDECFTQVARLVRADKIIGGSTAKIGEQLVLNLVLLDAGEGRALGRAKRDTADAAELLKEAPRAAIVLLQPLLKDRSGYLKIASNVPEAAVFVDDERRIEGVDQVIALPAGPHSVRVAKDGFYSASADVLIKPSALRTTRVSLIPAKETIEAYESKADFMRWGGIISGALAVGSAALAVVFYSQATDDKEVVDGYALGSDLARSDAALRERALVAKDSFDVNQGLYLGGLAGAAILGGASLYFFLAGDDPDRYAEFRGVSR